MCKVGEVVVSGGVRRSAMISLSNLSDGRMRHAKSGQWWETAPQMALSNNSVCYTDKPDGETFLESGQHLLSQSQESVVYLIEYLQRNKQRSLAEEMLTMSLALILAVK